MSERLVAPLRVRWVTLIAAPSVMVLGCSSVGADRRAVDASVVGPDASEPDAAVLPHEPLEPFGLQGYGIPPLVAALGPNPVDTPEELEAYLRGRTAPAFVALGAPWARVHPEVFGSFAWGVIDSDRDGASFDFRYSDTYVRSAHEAGIHLLPSLGPMTPQPSSTDWLTAGTYVPADMDAYTAYVRATVERYDGDGESDMDGLIESIRDWQLDNEADLHNSYRDGGYSGFESPAEYAHVLVATHRAMKDADTEARLMPSLAGVGQSVTDYTIEYLRRLMAEIEDSVERPFEAFSYHVYPDSYDLDAVESQLAAVQALVGEGVPIWITETSITSREAPGFEDNDRASEAEQARWLAKTFAYQVASGVRRILWLGLTDMSPGVGERLHSYTGLMTFGPPAERKASYYTFGLLARTVGSAVGASTLGPGLHVFDLGSDDRAMVVWSESAATIDLSATLGMEVVRVTHIVEDTASPEPVVIDGIDARSVPVGESPVIIERTRTSED